MLQRNQQPASIVFELSGWSRDFNGSESTTENMKSLFMKSLKSDYLKGFFGKYLDLKESTVFSTSMQDTSAIQSSKAVWYAKVSNRIGIYDLLTKTKSQKELYGLEMKYARTIFLEFIFTHFDLN